MYLVRLVNVVCFVVRFLKKQERFNNRYIGQFLRPISEQYHAKPGISMMQKIEKYYCRGIPVTCAAYAKIYGRDLSEDEKENSVLAGIITPLIDDFTDKKMLSQEQLDALISFSGTYQPSTMEEAIVKDILNILIGRVTSVEGVLSAFHHTIEAQHESARQLEKDLSEEELMRITVEKGAWSYLLLHYLIEEVPSKPTIEVIHKMGGILQLCNDIFDIHKDFLEGVRTVPNTCTDYHRFEIYYRNECRKFCAMARSLPCRKKDIEFFITLITIVMARGLVALRMLGKLQQNCGGGSLPLQKLQRKQLICDMEKPANFLWSLWYAYTIVK